MTSPRAAPRPGRWFLAIYLVLLGASHLVRRLHPHDGVPDESERVVTLHAVSGDRETAKPVRLAYFDAAPDSIPDAPVVVLLHGSPGDHGAFWSVAPQLAERYHVIAPDLPGFGGSTRRIPDYSIAAHARYVLQLLDSLHIARVDIVGFSMGGGVALDLASDAPDRVRSLTLLSAIGAQEYELAGEYHLNHAIHGLQLAGLWGLRELVPHFGWLDDAMLSVEYARNFYDSDQRPLRGILGRYVGPMLILHGEKDPLVTPAAAREHARLVPQSELVMYGGDHFMVFQHPEMILTPLQDFLARVERGEARTRATALPDRVAAAAQPFDPTTVPRTAGLALIILLVLIAASTMVSEDLTCIATGLLISRGTLGLGLGTLACFLGIFLGDVFVFLCGRVFGRAVLGHAPLRWFLKSEDVERSSQWFQRLGGRLVFATRVLPGTRLPTYFAAGMLKTSFWRFTLYFFVACLIWTPAVVWFSAAFGETAEAVLGAVRSRAWTWLLVTSAVLFVLVKLVVPLCSWRGRRLLLSRWRRISRWEFWPRWAFYPPVVCYVLYLAARHRSLTLFTAGNPAIPGGGFIGESKGDILDGLKESAEYVARTERLPGSMSAGQRLEQVRRFQDRTGTGYPIVLKPDVGERGSGVAMFRSEAEALLYLESMKVDLLVQEFLPGFEFGLFYIRRPDDPTGQLFSVTEKRLLFVTGNGRRTLEELILADDRAVCMAPFHLRRHATRLAWVPAEGETVQLVEVGTHSRGAAFFDGSWVRTPELEAAIDRISRAYPGFFFGRYDVKAPALDDFRAGRNFRIVELNGVTSEATSIYDPGNSLGTAYRTLFTQWRILFEIAARNVELGARPASLGELWGLLRKRGAVGATVSEP
jgi:pimeloyl-ACP methyl ester carboxylesterase/membrane protein DedA with SNARE-associated domain